MKEKKELATITIKCDNKEELKNVLNSLKDVMVSVMHDPTKDDSDEPEPEAFRPKKGDICTCVENDGPTAIFLYNGRERIDEYGFRLLESELSLEYSGNLLQPYIVIRGEGQEVPADDCRLATASEVYLFQAKIKIPKDNQSRWNVGDWVYVVGCEAGCNKTFYSVPVTYAETKTMENLLKRGWIFDKESDCNALCDKLNEAIKNMKP